MIVADAGQGLDRSYAIELARRREKMVLADSIKRV